MKSSQSQRPSGKPKEYRLKRFRLGQNCATNFASMNILQSEQAIRPAPFAGICGKSAARSKSNWRSFLCHHRLVDEVGIAILQSDEVTLDGVSLRAFRGEEPAAFHALPRDLAAHGLGDQLG